MKAKSIKERLAHKFSVAASTNSERIHVIHSLDGWSVKKEGTTRSLSVKKDRLVAITVAEKLSPSGVIVVHETNGIIAELRPIVAVAGRTLADSSQSGRYRDLARGRFVSHSKKPKSPKEKKVSRGRRAL